MHADEVDTDASLVRRLLEAQFPQWAHLPIEPVPSAGTSNALYRLGGDMVVRMPRIRGATAEVDREHMWLPRLAPHLPLDIPVPLALGTPAEGYPWHWSVYRWLAGENAAVRPVADPAQAAQDLARFIIALQRIDTTGGPQPGPNNYGRGVPLARRDKYTREGIASLQGILDAHALAAATSAWEASVRTPVWDGPPVWIHGDLLPVNLLISDGRLSSVIDFGCLGVGDPACDLQTAWNLFTPETRPVFRAALAVDDATWLRGRGWALSVAVIALPYYRITNPTLADISRYTIEQVLADHAQTS
jgi:aminoglycoside phosphotransferase (APT) family kinase protein